MPLGARDDPSSALGIIAGLGPQPLVAAVAGEHSEGVIGCVIGCVIDAQIAESYGLTEYGAEPGDGLLAFIGIVPEAQGSRFRLELPLGPRSELDLVSEPAPDVTTTDRTPSAANDGGIGDDDAA